MIIFLLVAWVLVYAAKSSVQTVARLRPAVAPAPARRSSAA